MKITSAIVAVVLVALTAKAIQALNPPPDELDALKPYALWTKKDFYRMTTWEGPKYYYTTAMDLTGISYADAVRLVEKTKGAEREPIDKTIMAVQDVWLIPGPVPYEPKATLSVSQRIPATEADNKILELLRRVGIPFDH